MAPPKEERSVPPSHLVDISSTSSEKISNQGRSSWDDDVASSAQSSRLETMMTTKRDTHPPSKRSRLDLRVEDFPDIADGEFGDLISFESDGSLEKNNGNEKKKENPGHSVAKDASGDIVKYGVIDCVDNGVNDCDRHNGNDELPDDFLEPLDSPIATSPVSMGISNNDPKTLKGMAAKILRQFWRSGKYDTLETEEENSYDFAAGMEHVRVHPKFLHSNATSHKWALGAIAELLDNSLDEVVHGATMVSLDMIPNPRDGRPMLMIQDDGGGMDPEQIRKCMSLGYSMKSKIPKSIGQYGNGFKTSTMRLGADVLVLSRTKGKVDGSTLPTQSIGLLSYTFLTATGQDDISVPMVDYEIQRFGLRKLVRGTLDDWNQNLDTILQWSPYDTERALFNQLQQIKGQGTIVIVYNLWEDEQGDPELDFDAHPYDIQLRGTNRDERSIMMASKYPNCKHYFTYKYSLRSYASILYLRLPKKFKIMLRGQQVVHHQLVNDLMFPEHVTYRPQKINDIPQKDSVAVVTLGFVKDAKQHVDVQGFNVYHKNRLIKPFWRVWINPGSQGRGIVGVLEANFVEPAHDKQGFERTTVFARLETRLVEIQKCYWSKNCKQVGYVGYVSKKKNPSGPVDDIHATIRAHLSSVPNFQKNAMDNAAGPSGPLNQESMRLFNQNKVQTAAVPTSPLSLQSGAEVLSSLNARNLPLVHQTALAPLIQQSSRPSNQNNAQARSMPTSASLIQSSIPEVLLTTNSAPCIQSLGQEALSSMPQDSDRISSLAQIKRIHDPNVMTMIEAPSTQSTFQPKESITETERINQVGRNLSTSPMRITNSPPTTGMDVVSFSINRTEPHKISSSNPLSGVEVMANGTFSKLSAANPRVTDANIATKVSSDLPCLLEHENRLISLDDALAPECGYLASSSLDQTNNQSISGERANLEALLATEQPSSKGHLSTPQGLPGLRGDSNICASSLQSGDGRAGGGSSSSSSSSSSSRVEASLNKGPTHTRSMMQLRQSHARAAMLAEGRHLSPRNLGGAANSLSVTVNPDTSANATLASDVSRSIIPIPKSAETLRAKLDTMKQKAKSLQKELDEVFNERDTLRLELQEERRRQADLEEELKKKLHTMLLRASELEDQNRLLQATH